jgi:hypothetical protein
MTFDVCADMSDTGLGEVAFELDAAIKAVAVRG